MDMDSKGKGSNAKRESVVSTRSMAIIVNINNVTRFIPYRMPGPR
jgi:hypothetical protein